MESVPNLIHSIISPLLWLHGATKATKMSKNIVELTKTN